ncbi:MAG TPA: hypothetical protein DGG95_11755, partial [Cytophagales bacterium]|nr:hypothetical protein [Cytophagales bacterium]
LSNYPVLKVKMKSFNKSKSLNVEMDLVDAAGQSTNLSPVFDFTPLIDDGAYYKYTFDFQNQNGWKSGLGNVDKTRINKINLFIDYGIFAQVASDSLWIDSLWVEPITTNPTVPNRPSHLKGTINGNQLQLSWQDNSANEDGFKLYRSTSSNGVFSLVGTYAPNATQATLTRNPADPTYVYQIISFNSAGTSDLSNLLASFDSVTDIKEMRSDISIFPNPSNGKFSILTQGAACEFIVVRNSLGQIVHQQVMTGETTLDLSELSRGVYFLTITTGHSNITKKISIQ